MDDLYLPSELQVPSQHPPSLEPFWEGGSAGHLQIAPRIHFGFGQAGLFRSGKKGLDYDLYLDREVDVAIRSGS